MLSAYARGAVQMAGMTRCEKEANENKLLTSTCTPPHGPPGREGGGQSSSTVSMRRTSGARMSILTIAATAG